jgi:hypothetical protein
VSSWVGVFAAVAEHCGLGFRKCTRNMRNLTTFRHQSCLLVLQCFTLTCLLLSRLVLAGLNLDLWKANWLRIRIDWR